MKNTQKLRFVVITRGKEIPLNEFVEKLMNGTIAGATSDTDASAHLVDENDKVVCEFNAHSFASGDRQITIHPVKQKMTIVVCLEKLS